MADPQQLDDEFGRRLAAARGYSRAAKNRWAEEVMEGIDRGTLSRYELGQIEPSKRAWAIERCIAATDLPAEFFAIDFNDLPEMVAAWRKVQSEEGSVERLGPELEEDEEDVLPGDPTELPPEEQGPEHEDQ